MLMQWPGSGQWQWPVRSGAGAPVGRAWGMTETWFSGMAPYYSTLSSLRNREIESETLIFAPISLSNIEID